MKATWWSLAFLAAAVFALPLQAANARLLAQAEPRIKAINYADGLLGDVLIITGSGESNTHVEITEGLVEHMPPGPR